MPKSRVDEFLKNIIIVFAGASVANALNLLYQLLVAHKLSPEEFANFNAILSIFMIISAPISTLQLVVAKYCAEFNALGQLNKLRVFLNVFFKKSVTLALVSFPLFLFICLYAGKTLKINSFIPGIILAGLLSSSCIPVFNGAIQGLELFKWQAVISLSGGLLKLALAYILIYFGFKISGALFSLLAANLLGMAIAYLILRGYFFSPPANEQVNYREIYLYVFPIALANFCFYALVNMDMLLVKYFFTPQDAGFYSVAQMLGKIFLFLPGAISIVMFPRAAGLKAKNIVTSATLGRSLLYTAILCFLSAAFYNIFPAFVLKILTGKVFAESVFLGRLFSISMSFFTLSYILIIYFLSLGRVRFLKILGVFCLCQALGIAIFHQSLLQVQLVLCLTAILTFFSLLSLARSSPN
ncbi:MAG: oligosaccharide flippase family protein [Candidatus Omnitrophota bacterium]